MKVWVPLALGGVVFSAYVLFYFLSSPGPGAGSFGLANSVGLVAVFVGLVVAGLLFRRAAPPR